jgi:dihydroflavonol-4-reductase
VGYAQQSETRGFAVRCFVTGGSGLVGRNLIAKLIDEGLEVLAMVRSAEAANTVRDLGARPISADMTEADRLKNDLEGYSALFHLAAATDPSKDHDYSCQVNVTGTEKLIEASKKAKVPKSIYISTAAIILRGKPVYDADEP